MLESAQQMTPINWGGLMLLLGVTAMASLFITSLLPSVAGFCCSIVIGVMIAGWGLLE
jgi:hypothetical protein